MAANNYFGFTHGGTQYGAATAGAAYGGQTGYAVAPAATAATYGTQRAAATGYDTAYQAAAATQVVAKLYLHNERLSDQLIHHVQSAYYQQAAAAYPAAAPPTPQYDSAAKPAYSTPATYAQVGVVSTPYYQQAAAKPAYSTPATYAQTGARAAGGAAKPAYGGVYTATTAAASYPTQAYTAPAAQTPKQTTNRGNTAYDTALYNAATMYVAQQNKTGGGGGGWKNYNKSGVGAGGGGQQRRPKPPPKAQQLHYCDVCRISCAGPQTYKEHLEGQKHKKKEAAVKLAAAGASAAMGRAGGGSSLRCELCDVTCTGADAYAAHVRGIKHQKVVKLHTMLGKPIPSTEPTKLGQGAKKTVAGTPKIAFVASGGLSTVTNPPNNAAGAAATPTAAEDKEEELPTEEEVQPVGQDYIEEIRADDGKPLSFNCKLCDCKFNDPNAKEMHMKGRRHRLQYKKKVQPDLEVKVKPSMHQRKIAEAKAQRMMARDELWARRRYNDGMEDDERAYWEGGMDGPWGWRGPPPHHHPMHHGMGMGYGGVNRRIETSDDRHVLAKHADIYPGEQQLADIQRCVSHTEKALKSLSDALQETNKPKLADIQRCVSHTEKALKSLSDALQETNKPKVQYTPIQQAAADIQRCVSHTEKALKSLSDALQETNKPKVQYTPIQQAAADIQRCVSHTEKALKSLSDALQETNKPKVQYTPIQQAAADIQRCVSHTEKALKSLSDALQETNKPKVQYTPIQQAAADIQRCVSHTEKALKSLSDALQETNKPKVQYTPIQQAAADIQRCVSHTEKALKSLSDALQETNKPKVQYTPIQQAAADIQRCVSHTEKALKSLSDALQETNKPKNQAAAKKDDKKEEKPEGKEDGRDNQLKPSLPVKVEHIKREKEDNRRETYMQYMQSQTNKSGDNTQSNS
ncbi:zinc finger RNA-binding protein [Phthorimaea operculella]|nr:zinc finger RNA-binding protein [Phthorimaea operculella]